MSCYFNKNIFILTSVLFLAVYFSKCTKLHLLSSPRWQHYRN